MSAHKDFRRQLRDRTAVSNLEKLHWAVTFFRGSRCSSFPTSPSYQQCLKALPLLQTRVSNGIIDRDEISKVIQNLHLKIANNEIDDLNKDEDIADDARLAQCRKLEHRVINWAITRRRILLTGIKDDDGVSHNDPEVAADILHRKWSAIAAAKDGNSDWRKE